MEKTPALQQLLEQVKRIYSSNYGRTLSDSDWLSFQDAVEEFDRVSDGRFLGGPLSDTPLFLLQPAEALRRLIPDDSKVNRRARSAVSKYDFVFQVVTDLKRSLQVAPIVAAALKSKGLDLGMSLTNHAKAINDVEATRKVFPDESSTGPYWSLYWFKTIKDGYEMYNFKFSEDGVARFHRQRWSIEIMGVKTVVDRFEDLYDTFAQEFAKAWEADPGSFVRTPLVAILHEQTIFAKDNSKHRSTLFRHVAKGTPQPPTKE